MSGHLYVGDALKLAPTLSPGSADMVLTSPPYFRLRDYGVSGQLGAEPAVDDWVDNLRALAQALHDVLTPTGTFWLNLGDTYATQARQGAARKSLLLGPERLALALLADGWLLRNKIAWRKANPMPTPVPDRLACTWEYVYVFAKSPGYFFDLDAIREPHTSRVGKRHRRTALVRGREAWRGANSGDAAGLLALKAAGLVGHPLGKNPGDLWITASSNYRGSHRATFPTSLVERAIRAGCPEARCSVCRVPWRRRVVRTIDGTAARQPLGPTCACNAPSEPGVVLDPFLGSGTTAVVAESLGRDWVGIELNPDFAREAETRIAAARSSPTRSAA